MRWTADFDDEGDVSGDSIPPELSRNLFNFRDAAERLAPHAPGENFDGFSSDVDSGGGGVLGITLT